MKGPWRPPRPQSGSTRRNCRPMETRNMNNCQRNKGRVAPAGLGWAPGHGLDDPDIRALINKGRSPIIGGASIGDAVENKILDHMVANATYTAPTPSLGLWTSTLT